MPDLPTSPFVMSNDALDRQCNRFHELFNQYLNGKDHTIQPMTEDAYDQRVTFLKMLNSGSTSMTELRTTYPRAYDWMKRYELIVFGTSEKRVVMQKLRNDVWVLIDEMGDGELARVQSTEDEGPVKEWGLYYRHPTVFDFAAAKLAVLKRNMEQSEAEEKLNESPT
jgi:hypothetical protein